MSPIKPSSKPMLVPAVAAVLFLVGAAEGLRAADLYVGGAAVSITPDRPVALDGQMHTRISQGVQTPVTANALAIESRDGDRSLDAAVMVSCDLVAIDAEVLDRTRSLLKDRLPDFDPRKLVVSATHTHTAPVVREGIYLIPKDGVMQPAEYLKFVSQRIADAAAGAWKSRKPGRAGWGLGHAVVGRNRRSVYADGRGVMYGPTNQPGFRNIEGPEDHGVEVLFFWNAEGELTATAVNLACPSQEVEGLSVVNADFWHQVRESLRAKHGKDLVVLGWPGAAGDQSPHLTYRKQAEERMRTLRGLSRLAELAGRIVAAWEEAYDGARKEQHADAPLTHQVVSIKLPVREVTDAEAAEARSKVEALSKDPANQRIVVWEQAVIDRYDRRKAGAAESFEMELHAIRLGDVAIATNVFELFTDYGIQIKARSPALQTFVIQLAGPGSYLPTDRARKGGGYSAIVESNLVGPEGGQALVEETLKVVDTLWPKD